MNNNHNRKKVQKLIQDRNYEGAHKALLSMIRSDPHNATSLSTLGDVLVKLGNTKIAIEYYEQAVAGYLKNKLPVPALTIARKILRVGENSSRVYFLMGRIYHSLDKQEEAEVEFLKYLETVPEDSPDAMAVHAILSEYHPDDAAWKTKLPEDAYTVGETIEESIIEETTEEPDPESGVEPLSDNSFRSEQTDTEESLDNREEVVQGSPDDTETDSSVSLQNHIDSAKHLLDNGDSYEAAMEYLKACRLLRCEEKESMVYDLLDNILEISPENLPAAKELLRVSKLRGVYRSARALYMLAAAHLLNGNFPEALEILDQVDETAGDDREHALLRELLNSNTGLTAGRTTDLESDYIRTHTEPGQGSIFDGIHAELSGKVDSIQAFYNPEICFENGIDALELELYEEAVEEFRKTEYSQAYRVRARYNTALCLFYLYELNKAEAECLKGIALCNGEEKKSLVGYFLLLADIYEKTDRQELAGKLKNAIYELEADSNSDSE